MSSPHGKVDTYICACSVHSPHVVLLQDGHIHIFQDGELVQEIGGLVDEEKMDVYNASCSKQDVDVQAQIKKDESTGWWI